MTAETTRKVTILTPDEWKALCINNTGQLHGYLQSIPGVTEGGISGLSDQHLAMIDHHLGRFGAFLNAWKVARVDLPAAAQPQEAAPQAEEPKPNGMKEPKRKGGWPKGKPRGKQPEAGQQ